MSARTPPPPPPAPEPQDSIDAGRRLVRVRDDRGLSLADRLINQFYRLTWSTPLHAHRLKGRYPLKLLAVPDDPIPGDPRAGKALRAGHLLFRGQKQLLSTIDFRQLKLQADFVDYIHSFAWLRDLAAAATREQGAPIAEKLMRGWLAVHAEKPSEPAWRADNAGWRLLFWTAHAPLILSSTDLVYRSAVLNCIARTARHLDQSADKAPVGLPRLTAWAGIVAASLLIPGGAPRKIFGEAGLAKAIASGMHSDGGALTRSPLTQLRTVMLLAMLRAVYDSRRESPPAFLTDAIDQTVPALQGVCLGDGALSSWQGAGALEAGAIRAVIAASGVRARPLREARDWGYQRISAGRTIAILDAAPPPAAQVAEAGCASTLAFEMSDGDQRMIVNCGGAALAGGHVPPKLAQGLRSTAAHSTLTLGDLNSTAVHPDGTLGRGVSEVELERQEIEAGSRVEASHDGYVKRLGFTHRRLLLMRSDGGELRGEDMLVPIAGRRKPAAKPFAVRFHLAPHIEPAVTADSQGALLRLPGGSSWQFRSGGATLAVEESIWVDGDGRPHPCQQLVLSGEVPPGGASIGWLLKRLG